MIKDVSEIAHHYRHTVDPPAERKLRNFPSHWPQVVDYGQDLQDVTAPLLQLIRQEPPVRRMRSAAAAFSMTHAFQPPRTRAKAERSRVLGMVRMVWGLMEVIYRKA